MTEPLDRNKTDLTHRVTAVASAYLDSRGFKPIESEVSCVDGIADLASFVYPTPTELKKMKLIDNKEIIQKHYDHEYFLFQYGCPLTAIVEVKTSRQDYLKDEKKKFDGRVWPAHLCYLAYPRGLIEKVPEGWIGLETSADGEQLLRVKAEGWGHVIHPQNPGDTLAALKQYPVKAILDEIEKVGE